MRGGDREQTPILDYRLMTGNPICDRLALRLHPKVRDEWAEVARQVIRLAFPRIMRLGLSNSPRPTRCALALNPRLCAGQ